MNGLSVKLGFERRLVSHLFVGDMVIPAPFHANNVELGGAGLNPEAEAYLAPSERGGGISLAIPWSIFFF